MNTLFSYQTEIGVIRIAENGTCITHLYFNENAILKDAIVDETPLLKEAAKQLFQYLSGRRTLFDLPLAPTGTAFQTLVFDALLKIPYGETRSYRQIAEAVGNPRAFRAVGMANNKNPIPIFIPCHRVIGSNAALVGYAGGLIRKEYLLSLEKMHQ